MDILQKEAELAEIVQLVGSDALPAEQQITLETARLLREIYLQQNGFDPIDASSSLSKDYQIWKTCLRYDALATEALASGADAKDLVGMQFAVTLARARFVEDFDGECTKANKELEDGFANLGATVEVEA